MDVNSECIKNEVTLNFTLTKEEYAKGLLPSLSSARYQILGIFFVLAIFIQSLFDDYSIGSPQWVWKLIINLFSLSIVYMIVPLIIHFFSKRVLYSSYHKSKIYSNPVTFIFSEEGMVLRHDIGSTDLSWNAYEKYLFTDELCLLYLSKNCRHIIPLRVINEGDLKVLKHLLSRHIHAAS